MCSYLILTLFLCACLASYAEKMRMPRSLRQTGRIGGIIHPLGAIVLVTSLPVVAASKSACLFVPGYKLGDEENYASIKQTFRQQGQNFSFGMTLSSVRAL